MMKTRVYVDGYNLYYGCLKRTAYRWLDLVKLFEYHLLPQATSPQFSASSVSVKYFTADIKPQASFDETSLADQMAYHRALEATYLPERLEIIKGYFSIADEFAYKIDSDDPKKLPKDCKKVKVWKLEEKQTDVNIAIHALYDVMTDTSLQQIVFVTNDTDLAPALEMIASLDRVAIGLIVPIKDSTLRPASTMLRDYADWTMASIDTPSLRSSCLPRVITNSVRHRKLRTAIVKPNGWFGQKDLVEQILNVLGEVLKSPSQKWQWLDSLKPSVKGLPILTGRPSNLLDDADSAMNVLAHARHYVSYIKSNHHKS